MNTPTLVQNAAQMVHSTMKAFLKKADMNQMPTLVVGMVREAAGCLVAFVGSALEVKSTEDANILASLIIMHCHNMKDMPTKVAEDFEKLTGRKAPETLKKFSVHTDPTEFEEAIKSDEQSDVQKRGLH